MKKAMFILLVAACGGGSPSFLHDAGMVLATAFEGSPVHAQPIEMPQDSGSSSAGSQTLSGSCSDGAAKFTLDRSLVRSVWRCGPPEGTTQAGVPGAIQCYGTLDIFESEGSLYVPCYGWDHVELVIAP